MGYATPSFSDIRARVLRDVKNLDADADTSADSDHFVRASITASAVSGLYDYQDWLSRQLIPDTADTEYLEAHCTLRGLTRKSATKAAGTLTVTGTAGSTCAAGLTAVDADGAVFEVTASGTVGASGTAELAVSAAVAGAMPLASDVAVTLQSAPDGVQSAATLALTSGGSDVEADDALLARLLYAMRNPDGGGNKADYKRWAESVDGVGTAYVYPLRSGLGTVDIVITGVSGAASAGIVAACQSLINTKRPCTAKASTVIAAEALDVDFAVNASVATGATLTGLQDAIESAVDAYISTLPPGGTVVLSRVEAAVLGVAGVTDAAVVTPTANVTTTAVQYARLGTITLGALS